MKWVKTLLGEPDDYYGPQASIHAAEGEGCHRICLDWLATQHGFLPRWEEPQMPSIHPDPERWNAVLTRCLFSFHEFCAQYQIEPIGIEQEDRSKTYGLIGHIDLPAFFTVPGRRRIKGPIDLKFTSTVQESHHLQVPCYGRLDGMKGSQLGGIFNCNRETGAWKFIFFANEPHLDSFAEARSYLPNPSAWNLGPDEYLSHLHRIKSAVKVPVFASLNGTTLGGWLHHAALLQDAGADALELNVYMLATDSNETGHSIEDRTVEMLDAVKREIKIPVAVKLSPFDTSLSNFTLRLEQAGADGFVVFNRFYQPDLDIEELHAMPSLKLSTSAELLLRIRWLGRRCSMARA